MQNPHGHIIEMRSDNTVIVEIESAVVCARCAAGKGCGAGLLGSQAAERRVEVSLAEPLDFGVGDEVSISLQSNNVLRAAVIVYAYPLLAAITAAALAYGLGLGDLASACFALGGLLAGILFAKWRLRSARCLRQFTPVVAGHYAEPN
jgi:sigma-E factor negative regulatory protein RseC